MITIPSLNNFQREASNKMLITLTTLVSTTTYLYCCLNIMWCFATKTPFLFSKRFAVPGCKGLWRYEEQIKDYMVDKILIKDRNLVDKLVRMGDNLFSYTKTFDVGRNHAEEQEPLCYICYREVSAVINFPCLHTGLCKLCGFKAYLEKNQCPMCRQGIDKLIAYEKVDPRSSCCGSGYRQLEPKELPQIVRNKLLGHFYV